MEGKVRWFHGAVCGVGVQDAPVGLANIRGTGELALALLAGRTSASAPTQTTYFAHRPMTFVTLSSDYRTPRIAFV